MKTLAMQAAPEMARATRNAQPLAPMVQPRRASNLRVNSGQNAEQKSVAPPSKAPPIAAAITAPPITDPGRPLDGPIRQSMESGFRQDFGNVRVHDDARAHDAARRLGARAYAAGDHIVFGAGQYQPATVQGRALIAHELAHTVQQGGVQMKADGPMPTSANTELEGQADAAAAAVIAGRPVPSLSRVTTPAVFMATESTPILVHSNERTPRASEQKNLPKWVQDYQTEGDATNATPSFLSVTHGPVFNMPAEKGPNPAVKEAYERGGLVSTIEIGDENSTSSFKEDTNIYKARWLSKYGFSTLKELSESFLSSDDAQVMDMLNKPAHSSVKSFVTNRDFAKELGAGLGSAGCAIDHIVERHMGGSSVPSNLQLFDTERNSKSGRESWGAVNVLVSELRKPAMLGENANKIQIIFREVTIPASAPPDSSYDVEQFLGKVIKGIKNSGKISNGKPVELKSGPNHAISYIEDKGISKIDKSADRVLAGATLLDYTRGTDSKKTDLVTAKLEKLAKGKLDLKEAKIKLVAAKGVGTEKTSAGSKPPTGAEATVGQAEELRELAILPGPYQIVADVAHLSPAVVTSLGLDKNGDLTGSGVITSSIKFLGKPLFEFGPNYLKLSVPIDAKAINATAVMKPLAFVFRFIQAGSGVEIPIAPDFKPEGTLNFSMGPAAAPVLLGTVQAGAEGGAFVANGVLTPAKPIPGIKDAKGVVSFSAATGWSGKMTADSESIPNSKVNVELGFNEKDGQIAFYGTGGITMKMGANDMQLRADWDGKSDVAYSGKATVANPLPLVDSVDLSGHYKNNALSMTGKATIKWRETDASMTVNYDQKDNEEGRFTGTAKVPIKTAKASGHVNLKFNKDGYSGSGSISYEVKKGLRPTLDVSLTDDKRVLVSGADELPNMELGKKWPTAEGGKKSIIKDIGAKFSVPTPVPGLTIFGKVSGSLGVGYGVGPVTLKGVKFEGSLYPLEANPQIKATLTGKLAVPAYGEIYGTFGASIGAEVLGGALGASGGIEVTPKLGVKGEGGIAVNAAYADGAFSFSAEAYAKGGMYAKLGVDLTAQLSAGWGIYTYDWKYPVASISKQLGPELTVKLGRVAYGKDGFTWPDVSQISVEPKTIDPMSIIKGLMNEGKANKK